ncbi:MAG: pirin family protein, partial [Actinomycetota bacterium]
MFVEVVCRACPGRGVHLYMIQGDSAVNGERMETDAAAQIWDEPRIAIAAA